MPNECACLPFPPGPLLTGPLASGVILGAYLGSWSKVNCVPWPWCTSQSTIRTLWGEEKGTLYKSIQVHLGKCPDQAAPTCATPHHICPAACCWPLNAVLHLSVASSHSHMVEHAISIHKTVLGVVSRRPGQDRESHGLRVLPLLRRTPLLSNPGPPALPVLMPANLSGAE